MKILLACSIFISTFISVVAFGETNVDRIRKRQILESLNSYAAEWIAPIKESNIKITNGVGRVDVNESAKFSYYIHSENPKDAQSKITLIPMATSRFTPTYYQTDEWWDKNKEKIEEAKRKGLPAPRQDFEEVKVWLEQMKLSSNPYVFEIENGKTKAVRLKDYLIEFYISKFAKNGKIRLYRGGEKATEGDDWLSGRKPRGARYWSPTAHYAWRYARKNNDFLQKLIDGKAPLFVFEMSVEQFRAMADRRWPHLTLGTELTKRAHDSFDSTGRFADHLAGNVDYSGIGEIGLEFEVRANSTGSEAMVNYFKSPISIEELANDRIAVIERAFTRLAKQQPENAGHLKSSLEKRKERIVLEAKLILALTEKQSKETVSSLLSDLRRSGASAEISYSDFESLGLIAEQHLENLKSNPIRSIEELEELNRRFISAPSKCRSIFQ